MTRAVLAATLAAHLALISALILAGGSALALLGALLLFAPLPGMLRADGYSFRWATLLLTFYVAFLLAEGYARPEEKSRWFALALLALADFLGLIACARITAAGSAARTVR